MIHFRETRILRMLCAIAIMFAFFNTIDASADTSHSYIDELLTNPVYKSTLNTRIKLITVPLSKNYEKNEKKNTEPIRFLIQGGLHGNEILTSKFVIWLAKKTEEGKSLLNSLPENSVIDFIPYANPDAYGLSRYNQNNVNLNRNFSILWGISKEPNGSHPFSEAETTAIRDLMIRREYLAAIDVHGYTNWIVVPSKPKYFTEQNSKEKTDRYNRWISAVSSHIRNLPSYELKDDFELGDGGSFEDWAFWSNNTLALCMELSKPLRFINDHGINKDSFENYESFIYQMFESALQIKNGTHKYKNEMSISQKNISHNLPRSRQVFNSHFN
ncbi:MAG: hypothetical protein HQK54_03305 [Oligoflexales bacterium]|nr:hypothetical protein [Oligoflexales bacterium]